MTTFNLYLAPFGIVLNSAKETRPLNFDPAIVALGKRTLSKP